jgi:16S rRNA G966 N2-methylase RsmD
MEMSRSFCIGKRILSLSIFLLLNVTQVQAQEDEKDVPYVPTPKPVVEKMLDMAEVQQGDYVIDLGSGDGRIVIEAARAGADGHGIEIDPEKIREARSNAEKAGVSDQVRFLEQDLFETDVSRASVVTLYLLPSVNQQLRPQLLEQLEPGTKVVSHRFNMGDWRPDRHVTVSTDKDDPGFIYDKTSTFTLHKKSHDIYFWVIPADLQGSWTWKADGHSFNLKVEQIFQTVKLDLSRAGETIEVENAVLQGRRFRFKATAHDTEYIFNGRVESGNIKGMLQVHSDDESHVELWDGSR